MMKSLACLAIPLVVTLSACGAVRAAGPTPSPSPFPHSFEEVQEASKTLARSAGRDPLAEHVVVVPALGDPIRGREGGREFFTSRLSEFQIRTRSIYLCEGGVAIQQGEYYATGRPRDATPSRTQGPVTVLWRMRDGDWEVERIVLRTPPPLAELGRHCVTEAQSRYLAQRRSVSIQPIGWALGSALEGQMLGAMEFAGWDYTSPCNPVCQTYESFPHQGPLRHGLVAAGRTPVRGGPFAIEVFGGMETRPPVVGSRLVRSPSFRRETISFEGSERFVGAAAAIEYWFFRAGLGPTLSHHRWDWVGAESQTEEAVRTGVAASGTFWIPLRLGTFTEVGAEYRWAGRHATQPYLDIEPVRADLARYRLSAGFGFRF